MQISNSLYGPVEPDEHIAIESVQSFRADAFPKSGPLPWLDRPDVAGLISAAVAAGRLSAMEVALIDSWIRDGYIVLERFFSEERLDAAWSAYERAIADGLVAPPAEPIGPDDVLPGRVLNPHFHIREVDEMLRDPELVGIVDMLLGAKSIPFQTIIGHKGSQQLEHSDAIHMTSYPLGYLAAAWVAFEDISTESGPLVYYPGSHKLPYVFSHDVGISEEDFRTNGYADYHAKYEPRIQEVLREAKLEPVHFHANRGDVLLWHGNLIHGGSARRRTADSRRALVCHYFAEGTITYHDLASSKSHLHVEGFQSRQYD